MVNNKRAKQTLAIVPTWDLYRNTKKRVNNNVVVSLDSSRRFYLLGGWIRRRGSNSLSRPWA